MKEDDAKYEVTRENQRQTSRVLQRSIVEKYLKMMKEIKFVYEISNDSFYYLYLL